MVEVKVHIPVRISTASVPYLVEKFCATEGLILTMKGTLAKYPGCVHWHYKKGKKRGTLEITWWERESRLWFKVTQRRTGAWVEEAMGRLKEQIEHILQQVQKE